MTPAKQTAAQRDPGRTSIPLDGAAECVYCHQWVTSNDDGYCSFCGHLLLPLEIQPDNLILISGLAPQKELTFRNASQQKLEAIILPRAGPPFPALVIEPGGTFDLPPDLEVKVRVRLDAERLGADFQERQLDYVCLVNNDQRKQFPLRFTIRRGPQPKLFAPQLQFGDVEEGRIAERRFEIGNGGGLPLRIDALLPEGSPRLRLQEAFAPTFVAPGQRLSVTVLWDGNAGAAPPEGEAASKPAVRVKFGNHPTDLLLPVTGRTIRFGLAAQPAAVRLPKVLVNQEYTVDVELRNSGTADIEIAGIESDRDWIKVVSSARSFTLLCAGGDAKARPLSPTTFAGTHRFTIVCHPQGLEAKAQEGKVTVRPIGHEPLTLPVVISVIHPKPYSEYIGIDFGTSNSVVAIVDPTSSAIELVEDGLPGTVPSPLIPSVLVFKDADTCIIGQQARNEMETVPDRFVRSLKRVLGYNRDRRFFDRAFSPEDLAERIIGQLVQRAASKLLAKTGDYYEIRHAIITVPANFFDLQIRSILEACRAAGLDTEDEQVRKAAAATHEALGQAASEGIILDEPSAAVLYFIHSLISGIGQSDAQKAVDRKEGMHLLVFDYGGGTLDVSVAHIARVKRETGIKVLANMGDNGIGGDGIDLSLMREILARCQAKLGDFQFDRELITAPLADLEIRRDRELWSDEVWRQVLRARLHLKDLAEEAKVKFAPFEVKQVDVEVRANDLLRIESGNVVTARRAVQIVIPRSKLTDLLQSTLQRCRQLIRSTLGLPKVRIEPGQIDYILHTGRQSLLPEIRECVRELFPDLPAGHDILNEADLKVCVAKGAALYGWMRNKIARPGARINFLSEGRLPHSYGVEQFSNLMAPEFDEIIERGSIYPTSGEKEYEPDMIPRSGYLNLKFYQNSGSSKEILRNPEVSFIGQISLDTTANGRPGCRVRIVVDANRKLEVFANDQMVTLTPARMQGDEGWIG